jgi:hypothetical protein
MKLHNADFSQNDVKNADDASSPHLTPTSALIMLLLLLLQFCAASKQQQLLASTQPY